ncbi:MAG: polymer-forming cytoskeletal protein [Candidatus Zixiibacteriota bacterium]
MIDPAAPVETLNVDSAGVVEEAGRVFISSEFRDGLLRALDSSGREWTYDRAEGQFALSEDAESRNAEFGDVILFVSGEDTIIVGRDRPEDWAVEPLRLSRFTSDEIHVRFEQYVGRRVRCGDKVKVDGLIRGDVYAQGEVYVSSTGVIDGDVYAPEITVRRGGMITGREEFEEPLFGMREEFDRRFRDLINLSAFVIFGAFVVVMLLVAFISFSVSPTAVERASSAIHRHPWSTIWVGLVGVPVYLLFSAIIGLTGVLLPVSILMWISLPWALLVGVVAFSRSTGRVALAAYGVTGWSPLKQVALGSTILLGLWALALALRESRAEFLADWGDFLTSLAIILSIITVASGFGALALTRFGRREYTPDEKRKSSTPPPPAPPPLPGTPRPPEPPPAPAGPSAPIARPVENRPGPPRSDSTNG